MLRWALSWLLLLLVCCFLGIFRMERLLGSLVLLVDADRFLVFLYVSMDLSCIRLSSSSMWLVFVPKRNKKISNYANLVQFCYGRPSLMSLELFLWTILVSALKASKPSNMSNLGGLIGKCIIISGLGFNRKLQVNKINTFGLS